LLISLSACKSKTATAFRETIVHKEDAALNILIGKGGPEEEKLTCMINKDFKGALRAVDKQELAFNAIIKEITVLPEAGVREGAALKSAAISYYTSIRDMQLSDREDIAQQEATYSTDTAKVHKAVDKILALAKARHAMYVAVNKKKEGLREALKKFDSANNL